MFFSFFFPGWGGVGEGGADEVGKGAMSSFPASTISDTMMRCRCSSCGSSRSGFSVPTSPTLHSRSEADTVGSGLWLVFPSYMVYEFARDILHGLSIASGDRSSKPARAATPTKEE